MMHYVDRIRRRRQRAIPMRLGLLLAAMPAMAFAADIELRQLDCGTMDIEDISYFSDAHHYDGQSAFITNGCYLVRNGDQLLLWEAGLPRDYLGNEERNGGWLSSVSVTIADQLSDIDIAPADIDFLGVSHFHGDHIGQANEFASATLLMSDSDATWIRENPPGNARRRLSDWFEGDAKIVEFSSDHDVFGDGSATILATPGHTPGHSSLLVNLSEAGYVLLTGDLYHFRKEIGARVVSRWNTSRADTLASMERVEAMIEQLDPIVVVQHDADDVKKLPAFPKPLK